MEAQSSAGQGEIEEKDEENIEHMTREGLDLLGYGITIFNRDLKLVRFNQRFLELLGYPAELGKIGQPFESFVRFNAERGIYGDGDVEDLIRRRVDLARSFTPHLFRRNAPNGRIVEIEGHPLSQGGFVTTYTDVTEGKKGHATADRLGRILDETSSEIYIINAGTLKFIQVNRGARINLGYSMAELGGMTPLDIKPEFSESQFRKIIEPLKKGKSDRIVFETRHRRANGTLYPVEVRIQLSKLESPPVFVAVIQDISERKEAEEIIWHQANYDDLTNLPNRTVFFDRLQMAQMQAQRDNRMVALFFLDLDYFKDVNDTEGHSVGDVLLKEVAKRLRSIVRRTDTVARLGGDEFGIIQSSIRHVNDSAILAEKIIQGLHEPFDLGPKKVFIGTSIGITIYPIDDKEPEQLLCNADIAMYAAKDKGRGAFEYFSTDMREAIKTRNQLEQDLCQAIEHNEIYLDYQPQVITATREIIGFEALVRWNHPRDGLIMPADFVPLAERSGLILDLGEWVLREACRQTKVWQDEGLPKLAMAVNLSAVQFRQEDLVDMIRGILKETDLDPVYLEFEITESTAMHDPSATAAILDELNDMGIKVSLDDFGTGYSSLAYLKRFSLHRIKIDRSFIRDVLNDSDDAAIVSAVIALGRSLNMKVTGEGVENGGQLEYLYAHGCDEIQGYYFSHPISPAKATALLKEHFPVS